MQIFLSKDGQQDGPFSLEQIKGQIRSNLLLMSTPAWVEGWEDWKAVTDIPGLIDPPTTITPVSRRLTQAYLPRPVVIEHSATIAHLPSASISVRPISSNEVLWSARPAWRRYAFGLALGLITLSYGIGLVFLLWVFLDRQQRRYVITRKSASLTHGLFFKSTTEIMLRDIRSIVISRKTPGALLGLAAIEFSSAARDNSTVVFTGITDAEKVKTLVNNNRSS
jgi:hypothetical protein